VATWDVTLRAGHDWIPQIDIARTVSIPQIDIAGSDSIPQIDTLGSESEVKREVSINSVKRRAILHLRISLHDT
jgi:hypothetical protein